ncbi:MAG: type II secretion system GspH family protein [Proteobacteria bacterium]|nr:type II secretion system GspH family protein [Pseudomonadota bacterium]
MDGYLKWKHVSTADKECEGHGQGKPVPCSVPKGFTSVELTIVIVVICAFFLAGAIFLTITSKSAYDIMAKHDLQEFIDFQDYYFKLTGRCLGEQGQSIRNDGIESNIKLENYSVSEGVSITIISGDPTKPDDLDNPVIFQAKHEKSDTVFEYNFQSGTMIER